MKICIISSSAIPTPPIGGYGGLELVIGNLAIELARRGNEITLFSARGSKYAGSFDVESSDGKSKGKLDVIETIDPSWDGTAEFRAFNESHVYISKNFGDNSVILDSTWAMWSYLMIPGYTGEYAGVKLNISPNPNMKIIHIHHGVSNARSAPFGVKYPRILGLSSEHAKHLSTFMHTPARYVWNGIPEPDPYPKAEDLEQGVPEYFNGQPYLLSLNRITDEKGIHNSIDVAVQSKTPIIITGDDTKVRSQEYVTSIVEKCRSTPYAIYLGLVDDYTKDRLLRHCKAVISCPLDTWIEGFGLFFIEGLQYGKPSLSVGNGGALDIILHGKTGFLGKNFAELIDFVPRLDELKSEDCIERFKNNFTDRHMCDGYLKIFEGIMAGDPSYNW